MAERQGFEPFSLHNLKQLHDAGGTDSQQLQPVAAVNCLLSDCVTANIAPIRFFGSLDLIRNAWGQEVSAVINSRSEAFSRIERKYFQAFVQHYKRRLRPITSAEAMPDSINENVDGSGTTDDVTVAEAKLGVTIGLRGLPAISIANSVSAPGKNGAIFAGLGRSQ